MTTSDKPPAESLMAVLFVDDEPAVIRAVLRTLGANPGFRIFTAAGGEEALGVLRAESVDVLVSDIDMPQMSGLELVRIARREFPTTLRILLTGAGTLDRAVNAINEGEVVRFLTKPFEPARFMRALTELRDTILKLRRERYAEAQRERGEQFFGWIEGRYPDTLHVERSALGEVVLDLAEVRAYLRSASPEVRAFADAD